MRTEGRPVRSEEESSLSSALPIITLEPVASLQVESRSPQPRGRDVGEQLLPALWFLGAAALVVAAYLARRRLLKALASWWVVADELDPAGAVVVLPGDPPRMDCLRRAIELKDTKWVPLIVLVDSESPAEPNLGSPKEQEASKLGVPSGGLLVTRQANPFSVTAFVNLREVLLQHHLNDIILVTPSIYTRRAYVLSGTPWVPQGIRVSICPVAEPDFRIAGWWETRTGRATMFKEVAEVAKNWWELSRMR